MNLSEQLKKLISPNTAEISNKPAAADNMSTVDIDYDLDEILKKIDEQIPPKPVVKLEPKRAERELSVFESKLGGVPYMPADFDYPKGKSGIFEGRPLRLLAQLNFEKLPHIEKFPQKGILQFFCSDEETGAYGRNFKNPIEQDGFRIIYHENIIADESRLMPKENMTKFTTDMGNFPFEGEFLLEAGEPESCLVSSEDYHFTEAVYSCLNEIVGREIKSFVEAEEAGFGDDFWTKIYDAKNIEQTCIGGYPFFTQGDPREYKEEIFDYDVLLFQLTSSYKDNRGDEIMWGDMGVANFFITEDDLKNLDFSKVAYNWDCS